MLKLIIDLTPLAVTGLHRLLLKAFSDSVSILERFVIGSNQLSFVFLQLGSAILDAVENNTLSVEPVGFQPLPVVKASAVECGGPK